MKIRVRSSLVWLYDWNSTDGELLTVRPRTAARWRRTLQAAMRLNAEINRQLAKKNQAKTKAVKVA